MDYLKSFKSLMKSMQEKYENNEEILFKLLPLMILEKYNQNDLLIEYGTKWTDIYLILNGKFFNNKKSL